MTLRPLLLAAGLVLLAACGSDRASAPTAPTPHSKLVTEWLVQFEPGADASQVALDFLAVLAQYDATLELGVIVGAVDPGLLLADARVKLIQENHVVGFSRPVDVTQGFHEGDWVDAEIAGQAALAPLRLSRAHQRRKGKDILVAVLDTGVESSHGHLAGRLLITSEVPADLGQEETNNGVDDDLDGSTDEAYGHGTHVSGIVLTVAPAATVLPIRVLNDDGFGFAYNLARGLGYARDLGADVVNMSLVLSNDSAVVKAYLQELAGLGIDLVCAAGNTPGTVGFPATDPHTIGVAATEVDDRLASFSGAGDVAFAAPGVAVESSYPNNGSAFASGTSMAAPVVSGTLALLRCCTPEPDPKNMIRLERTAANVFPFNSVTFGRVAPDRVLQGRRYNSGEKITIKGGDGSRTPPEL